MTQYYEGIGRRKEASARVRLYPGGTGRITINDKDGPEFMPRAGDMEILLQPLTLIGQERNYDISVHVNGGGVSGQRDAIRLGIARALLLVDPELKSQLRGAELLTRDARVKERKKPGLKRARKAPTYTKR
ncbi:MAG: 30S ribosomal protein S9 [Anaerolineae bacterium]|jgi:small subunit ribosomal protein S9|uniref:30S ribosomal protein S9 n=1 Tax=Candidatus Flexifilum breve TaxID=3140694 RepID=UPI001AD35AA3|nr:30S ribosomal protein S9 [Chloroflexota bacterium]MBK9748628.1 30S ribosomal protein S9 [Chloroflexota bacterium]MBN8634477.1 30S ribosomal protein S9 [Anaerolineae bacterium]